MKGIHEAKINNCAMTSEEKRIAHNLATKKWREKNKEKLPDYFKKWYDNHKTENVERVKNWRKANPEWCEQNQKEWRAKNPTHDMFFGAKRRAKKKGVPFNIEKSDLIIPDVCPILGIPISRTAEKSSDNSPSLDRIKPELGYVKGNIAIISHRANSIKNNATVEELRKVADWLDSQLA